MTKKMMVRLISSVKKAVSPTNRRAQKPLLLSRSRVPFPSAITSGTATVWNGKTRK